MRPTRMLVPPLALILLAAVPAAGTGDPPGGWHEVRFDHRITQVDRDALERLGADVLVYRPRDAYLAWLGGDAARTAAGLPGISNVRPLSAEEKVDPLMELGAAPRPLVAVVRDHRASRLARTLDEAWTVLRVSAAQPDGALRDVVVVAPPSEALAIARDPDVLYVGPASPGLAPLDEVGDQIVAGNLQGASVAPGYEPWLDSHGLDGEGVRVAIVDTGVDPVHPDLMGRIAAKVDYSRSPSGEPVDVGGHGTHVAGIVGGNATGIPQVQRVRDANGFLYGLGVAPEVTFVDQNAIASTAAPLCNNGFWPPSYPWQTLTEDALDNGASIWNASWWSCEAQGGGYLESSRTMDLMVRDGHWQAEGNQPFTMVSAAANFGPSLRTIGSPWEMKNAIVVGASANARSGGNPNTMAGFSSRGPAVDGRILPTVAAPGQTVISTRSTAGTTACSTPVTDSFGLYSSCSGTSMATPHVAGSVALITQWWRRAHDGADPSPAMSKALLVNSASDMGAPDIPNPHEGWGRVNLGALFDPATERIAVDQSVLMTDPGEAASFEVQVADPSRPLKVTLVWTDAAAAAGANPALVNDLDLVVEDLAGVRHLGNRFSGGRSVTGGAPDILNNIENVFLPSPADTYTVTVSAANLPGDGVPGAGDETDQDFALVVSNAIPVTP